MYIFIVTMKDGYDMWSEAVFADSLTHAREVAEIKFDARIVSVRRASK